MEAKEMFINQFGENTVVPISNYNTLKPRSLVKDISKLYSIEFTEVNQVTSKMLDEAIPICKKIHGITAGVYDPTWEELKEHSESLNAYLKKYPHVAERIESLQKQIRSISRHAGGVLFADNLDEKMPLINSGGVIQTPWTEGQTVRHLEPLGFIKFDILGLKTLEMIETCVENILKTKGNKNPSFKDIKKFYDSNLHPSKINLEDSQVYDYVFGQGNFCGTFQFTNSGAKNFCVQAKPKSIVDIAAITSIYRPGPLSAKVDEKYIEAKNNPNDIFYMHDLVREVTEETYGFIVFQEQLSLLAHKLGKDISLDEGNELRKVLTKKGTGKEVEVKEKLYGKFIDGCKEKGIRQIVKIKKLNINTSSVSWEVDKDDSQSLIQPLTSIKGLGETAINEIMKYRPFKTVDEVIFHEEISYSKFNKRALDALIRAGAMDDLIDKRFNGAKHFWSAVAVDRPKTPKKFAENIEKYKPEGDFTDDEKIENLIK